MGIRGRLAQFSPRVPAGVATGLAVGSEGTVAPVSGGDVLGAEPFAAERVVRRVVLRREPAGERPDRVARLPERSDVYLLCKLSELSSRLPEYSIVCLSQNRYVPRPAT